MANFFAISVTRGSIQFGVMVDPSLLVRSKDFSETKIHRLPPPEWLWQALAHEQVSLSEPLHLPGAFCEHLGRIAWLSQPGYTGFVSRHASQCDFPVYCYIFQIDPYLTHCTPRYLLVTVQQCNKGVGSIN